MVGFGDLTNIFGKIQEMQANMQKLQEELEHKTIEANSGGGMVTARVNGKGTLLDLKINREMVDFNDVEMLEDLVKAAVNAAITKSQQAMKEEMAKLTGGLNIPGIEQLGKLMGLR